MVNMYTLDVRLVVIAMAAIRTFVATVQGHRTSPSDLHNSTARDQLSGFGCGDVSSATWPTTSVSVELLPVDELRATVSDRKQVAVHVTVGVSKLAPTRDQMTNCDNKTATGYSTIL